MDDINILLVEDNEGDIRLIKRAFETRDLPGTVHTVQRGDQALDWLYRRGEFAKHPRPDLVLLDLNLPATSGQEILDEVKSEPRLRRIPIIVLTSSQSDADLTKAYDRGANSYLLKPVDPEEFADLIQTFTKFWISAAALPPRSDDS